MVVLALLLLLLLPPSTSAAAPPAVVDLRVEYAETPVRGVGVRHPRFSWSLVHPRRGAAQHMYRVTVHEAGATAAAVWDSGAVQSNATLGVRCDTALQSDTAYQLSVAWNDGANRSSPAGEHVTTALLDQQLNTSTAANEMARFLRRHGITTLAAGVTRVNSNIAERNGARRIEWPDWRGFFEAAGVKILTCGDEAGPLYGLAKAHVESTLRGGGAACTIRQ